ncbi:ABC transporter permease [Clostridioides sp. ZZV15-6388]|uniref:ABC transporter permease n=1 Tax=Clostridioides sp. ZZV15-6388 TaxID=2811499 RepID=UPI001D126755|nr:ABC transporter permease [Clostridioides sp. ZZV15-6388]
MLVQSFQNYLVLIKENFKLSTLINLICSIGMLCLIPFIQGVANLDSVSAAICLENYVVIVGIIMLVPIFYLEQSKEIDEIVSSKSVSQVVIQLIRIIMSIISMLVLITGFVLVLKHLGGNFPIFKYIVGSFASAMFIGSLGMLFSNLFNNTIIGYMVSIGYLILNMMTRDKYVGNFFIMSMSRGSFDEKYWLICGSIVLIIVSLLIKPIKRKIS